MIYNNSAAARRPLRDLPRRDTKAHLALVTAPKSQTIPPIKPAVAPAFTSLVQEFLDECGYSDK